MGQQCKTIMSALLIDRYMKNAPGMGRQAQKCRISFLPPQHSGQKTTNNPPPKGLPDPSQSFPCHFSAGKRQNPPPKGLPDPPQSFPCHFSVRNYLYCAYRYFNLYLCEQFRAFLLVGVQVMTPLRALSLYLDVVPVEHFAREIHQSHFSLISWPQKPRFL